MKKGINNWQVVVTSATSGVTNYEDFISVDLTVGGTSIPVTITEITGSVFDGYYDVEANITTTGNGRIAFSVPASSNYFISPEFDNFVVDSFDADDIYARFLSGASITPANQTFINLNTRQVEADDIEFTVQIPARFTDLGSWTDWGIEFRTSDNYTTTPDISSATATLVDAANRLVTVTIPGSGTLDIVTSQEVESINYIGDIRGTDQNGDNKTTTRITMELLRQYTRE